MVRMRLLSCVSSFSCYYGEILGRQLWGGRIYLGSRFQSTQSGVTWTCIWAEDHGGENKWQRTSFHFMHDQEAQRQKAARNNMSPTICSSGLLPPTRSHLPEFLQSPQIAPAVGKQAENTICGEHVALKPNHQLMVFVLSALALFLCFFSFSTSLCVLSCGIYFLCFPRRKVASAFCLRYIL